MHEGCCILQHCYSDHSWNVSQKSFVLLLVTQCSQAPAANQLCICCAGPDLSPGCRNVLNKAQEITGVEHM